MGKKVKDYYDVDYGYFLAKKIEAVYPAFVTENFISLLQPEIDGLAFNDRQLLIARALYKTIGLSYQDTISIFTQILGPELEGSLGMFTEGWWLWPLGKYVELYGADDFVTSTAFSKELTKRFTSEYCLRPIIENYPEEAITLLLKWSTNQNKRVRRCASECLRIRLPWAKKMLVVLNYFEPYKQLLTNLKDDSDKTIQKSVANNLNDLYKEDPDKFEAIITEWTTDSMTSACSWIIKHGSRTKEKKYNKKTV